ETSNHKGQEGIYRNGREGRKRRINHRGHRGTQRQGLYRRVRRERGEGQVERTGRHLPQRARRPQRNFGFLTTEDTRSTPLRAGYGARRHWVTAECAESAERARFRVWTPDRCRAAHLFSFP